MSVLQFHSMRPAVERLSDKNTQTPQIAVERQSPVISSRFGVGQAGFSLIEVLVVLAIMVIVAGLAAPSITTALEKQRNKELSQAVVSALKEARNEALFRHQNIEVKYDDSGLTVSQTKNASNEKDLHIRTYPIGQGGMLQPNVDTITFNPNKTVSFSSVGKTEMEIQTMCNKDSKKGRTVKLDRVGNISIDTEGSQC